MKPNLLSCISFVLLVCGLISCFDDNLQPGNPTNAVDSCRLVKTVLTYAYNSGGTRTLTNLYHYDNQNNVVKEEVVSFSGQPGSTPDTVSASYQYDNQHKVTRKKTATEEVEYSYNSAGYLAEALHYKLGPSGQPELNYLEKYIYNAASQLDSVLRYPYSSNQILGLSGFSKYGYFQDGNVMYDTAYYYRPDGSLGITSLRSFQQYDTYKNPYAQPDFSLRSIMPEVSKNNYTAHRRKYSADIIRSYTNTYLYNAHGLPITDINKELNTKTEYIYDCK